MTGLDAMAHSLAELVTGSDRGEIEEVVSRWQATAGTPAEREVMDRMGKQLVALKGALDLASTKPTREEIELALRTMLGVAAAGSQTFFGR